MMDGAAAVGLVTASEAARGATMQDAETIVAVLRGDTNRYAELVDRYQAPALRLAFSLLGNYEDARDASQEAFVRAYDGLRRFRRQARFSTWVYRIVVNTCHDAQRRRSRRPIATAAIASGDPDEHDTGVFVDVGDPSQDPRSRAIGALPMTQRTAFVLHHVHGLSLEEVAGIMDCRVGTVKSHVFRATQRLQSDLQGWMTQEER
jgi:RNA polymerase sigma-70 factor (ECF subfamily)